MGSGQTRHLKRCCGRMVPLIVRAASLVPRHDTFTRMRKMHKARWRTKGRFKDTRAHLCSAFLWIAVLAHFSYPVGTHIDSLVGHSDFVFKITYSCVSISGNCISRIFHESDITQGTGFYTVCSVLYTVYTIPQIPVLITQTLSADVCVNARVSMSKSKWNICSRLFSNFFIDDDNQFSGWPYRYFG